MAILVTLDVDDNGTVKIENAVDALARLGATYTREGKKIADAGEQVARSQKGQADALSALVQNSGAAQATALKALVQAEVDGVPESMRAGLGDKIQGNVITLETERPFDVMKEWAAAGVSVTVVLLVPVNATSVICVIVPSGACSAKSCVAASSVTASV